MSNIFSGQRLILDMTAKKNLIKNISEFKMGRSQEWVRFSRNIKLITKTYRLILNQTNILRSLPRSVEENAKLLGYMFDKIGEFQTFRIGASGKD